MGVGKMKILVDTYCIIRGHKIFIELNNPSCKEEIEMEVKIFDKIMQEYFEDKMGLKRTLDKEANGN